MKIRIRNRNDDQALTLSSLDATDSVTVRYLRAQKPLTASLGLSFCQ
jgi:hypothetical protein